MVFLAVWGVVFFGLSYFWHISPAAKFDLIKAVFYSFMTAFIALACLTAIVLTF